MKVIVALLLALSLWACSVTTVMPSAPRNVLLAKDRTEPVVAIDPRHPSTIIVGSNTNYDQSVGGTYPVGVYTSQNAGRSFSSSSIPTLRPYTIGADPTLAFAASGTAFYTYLGESPAYCGGAAGTGAVMLSRSTNAGRSFGDLKVVDADSADDKPNLAVESVPGGRAHVFVSWTRWLNGHSEIWITRSVNGGDTFSPPHMIVSSTSDNFGSVPVVGPNGHVYVFWSSFPEMSLTVPAPTRILISVSTDDGLHFGPAKVAAGSFQGVPRMAQPGLLRNLTVPAATVGRDGAIFLAYARTTSRVSNGAVNADIDIMVSRDHGNTWTRPVAVNNVHHGDRFMPAMTVMPDGSVGVAFYDRRNSLAALDTYAARVRMVGGTVRVSTNVRVNRRTAPIADIYYIKPGSTCFSPGRFFGDYIGVAADPYNQLCVVWSDTQLHAASRTDIWFARVVLPSISQVKRIQRHGRLDNSFGLWDAAAQSIGRLLSFQSVT